MSAAAQKPDLPEDEIHRWLRDHFAIDGRLELMPGECDLNFKLVTDTGDTFVCKISSGSDDLERLSAQIDVLTHLAKRGLTGIPEPLTSVRCESIIPLQTSNADSAPPAVGRVLTFVPGKVLSACAPYSAPLLRNLGNTVGQLNRALATYDHPAFHYEFDWDLANSTAVVERYRELIADPQLLESVDRIYRDFENLVAPRLSDLRTSVIHNDANDYNVLAEDDQITGLIDFGDMVHSYTICDLAIAAAYATLGTDDPMQTLCEMAIGHHEAMPIDEAELTVLFPLMRMRLAVSACMAAHQIRLRPDDPYLSISQEPIRKALPKLMTLDPTDVHRALENSLT